MLLTSLTKLLSIRTFSTKNHNSKLITLLGTMPKEQKHIAQTQVQRRKIKEKSSKYSPGKVTLQVLGTGAKGAPRSLYVFSDQSRYLFNCGEGTQRLAHEHKMKLAKLEHIFITQPIWNNIGGLPGAALTIQDVGVPEITLHGPPGLEEIFVATHRFIIIKDLQLRIAECNENTHFEDNVLKVKYVPLFKEECCASKEENQENGSENSDDSVEDTTDYYAHQDNRPKTGPTQSLSKLSKNLLQNSKDKRISMAFICQLQPRPGALCLDKCVRLGVPPGPLLGRLKSGETITLSNGNVVRPSDVCEPDDPGPIFIVIDCPTEEYLKSLTDNEIFHKYQSTATRNEDFATLIVHFSPSEIMEHPSYQQWMDQFSPSTQHLVLNDSNTCMGSLAVHRIQYKLNLLSKSIFPLLGDKGTQISEPNDVPSPKKIKLEHESPVEANNSSSSSEKTVKIEELSLEQTPSARDFHTNNCRTLFNFHLRPRKGSDVSQELTIRPSQFIEETEVIEDFCRILDEVKRELKEKSDKLDIKEFPRLLFLGTGSSIPNKTRNTSGVLLETGENEMILMDCGEGTYGQIVRFYGQDNVDQVLTKIKAVYISHLHADHHLGLIGFLLGRRKAIDRLGLDHKPVFLLAPHQILSWLNFYDKYFEDICREFDLIPNVHLLLNGHQLERDRETSLYGILKMKSINTCFVRHCPNAFGVSFVDENDHKVTYSGDTMPSDTLVVLGENSDILLHEATMEDELAEEAVVKMHSTTSQAIEIGKRMNARYTLLTHFSQRYAKLPRFNENFSENVGIAFDNMQIKLDELPLLPLLYPALKSMFAEHYEELENKAAKRQLRIEREKKALSAN